MILRFTLNLDSEHILINDDRKGVNDVKLNVARQI